jgi:5-formyltetrahydrofolate cyclo-ligase
MAAIVGWAVALALTGCSQLVAPGSQAPGGNRWSEEVALAEMPELDAIVCGSVAVTRDGRRCGKGEGYSDLEFAILRELGHPPVPVATTVHDLQVVASVPRDPTDQPLSVIATPTHAIRIKRPSAAPTGIDWTRLTAEDLEEMPILAELKRMTLGRDDEGP